jgi:CBS-domain-containing membrane protein
MTDAAPAAVRDFMTTDLVVTRPTDPIADLAQKMIDAHIHRLIVVDAERRPVGIVSSMDCMMALVRDHRSLSSGFGTTV